MPKNPSLVLINPWIHDFAAYDLWSKPLGLLQLAAYLRQKGYSIRFIDCLDVYHPAMQVRAGLKPPKRRAYGTGKFWKEAIPKPPPLRHINRVYSRYGILPDIFKEELRKVSKPKAILITSLMTYWYPGVSEAIRIAKEVHPSTPVILGGIYARLCTDHARGHCTADHVVTSSDPSDLLGLLNDLKIFPDEVMQGTQPPHSYPAFDLLTKIDYICLLTSTGCPYRCRYCSSRFLYPQFRQRDPDDVFEEILYWHRHYQVTDFAFYDDALLINGAQHFVPLMERIVSSGLKLRFHTPNAIHIREIDLEVARLMRRAGFATLRIGLETADFALHRVLDNKIKEGEFERGVRNLLKAGFQSSQIGAYIMVGLPNQSVQSVKETIDFVAANGAMPYLAEYSPIPHTDLWKTALDASEYDLASEPLFHNNTLLPCWDESKRAKLPELKEKVREARGMTNVKAQMTNI